MKIKVPQLHRSGGYIQPCYLGLSLPAWFIDELQSIDKDLYPIFHPYRVIWDDFMNQWEGKLEDPRFTIGTHNGFSEEIWGFPLKGRSDMPIEEGAWHVWRLCQNVGAWAHIVKLECKEAWYLQHFLDRLHLQATFRDQYGNKAWNEKRKEEEEEAHQKKQKNTSDMFQDVQKENSWLTRKAMEELERGNVNATNPTKEGIISYPGQTNHSKTVRLLDDEEGGLIIPPSYKDN